MNILSYTYCLNRVYKPTNYVNAKISKYIYIYIHVRVVRKIGIFIETFSSYDFFLF